MTKRMGFSGFWMLCGVFCMGLLPVQAQSPFLLADGQRTYRVDDHVWVLLDSTHILDIEAVARDASRFRPANGNLKFGYAKQNIWLQIKVQANPATEWFLEIPAPFLEYVDFYQSVNGHWHQTLSGYYRPYSLRAVKHTGHIVPILFGADSTATVYVKIAGASPKTFPVYIHEKEAFYDQVRYEDFGYGTFFGILAVMFFYNLFIFITLRQVNYLLYICTIVCTFLIFGSASGYAGKFLWPENPQVNFYAGRLSLSAISIFLVIFTIRFLEVRQYARVMYYALLALIPLALLAAVLIITNWLSSAGNNLITISTVMYLTTGIICRLQGNKNATYYVAAWAVYLVGGLFLTLRNSGVLPFNFWTTHFVEIGAALETILIAFALADQYRILKQEKENAQAHALQVQRETNELLERNVLARTEELSRANASLSETLETVRMQSRLIESKNAELDGFFYRVSHDLKGPISTLQGLHYLAKLEVKDEHAMDLLNRKNQQVLRLNAIISGLINLTKLHDSARPHQTIDFEKLVDDCLASFNTMEQLPGIAIKKEIQRDLIFYSEWTLINAIIQNLLENAIKYSSNKAPFIHIRIAQAGHELVIDVTDNGAGIAPEHQAKIFDMFYRATANAGGSGLGLYILKRSVDKLLGKIELNSKEGAGSTFTVRLPFTVEPP
jgi:signal transduction histidine kinase